MPSAVRPSDYRTNEKNPATAATWGTVAPAVDWNDRLATAQPEEFAELFHEAVTADFGAVARLHQMLHTASQWCRDHGTRRSSAELEALAGRLTDLGEELHLVGQDLDHEIRSRSYRATAAARVSPTVSARGTSTGRQNDTPVALPPSATHSLPRSR